MKRPDFGIMTDKEQRQAQAYINNYLGHKLRKIMKLEQTKTTELEVKK